MGVTGSVAAVKTPELFAGLRAAGHTVKVAPTGPALAFFEPGPLSSGATPTEKPELLVVRGQSTIYLDRDEWPEARLFEVGEPVLHIELRKWAEVLVIAPLDANTLAKLALGLCDNLLTCVYRAWDLSRPVVLAPAMNTLMWEHPVTRRHLAQLLQDHDTREGEPARAGPWNSEAGPHPARTGSPSRISRGPDPGELCEASNRCCARLRIVPPVTKRLACGDEGVGGMAAVPAIVLAVEETLAREEGR